MELLGKADAEQAPDLGKTLAALAPYVKGNQAEFGANRIVELLGKTEEDQVGDLGEALAALASNVKDDQAQRTILTTKFIDQRRPMPCDAAVANTKDRRLLVDMLKWPVCTGRDGIMLRLAKLQGSPPGDFGEFSSPSHKSAFKGDLRRFIVWLKTQRDLNGELFDVDGAPIWSPLK